MSNAMKRKTIDAANNDNDDDDADDDIDNDAIEKHDTKMTHTHTRTAQLGTQLETQITNCQKMTTQKCGQSATMSQIQSQPLVPRSGLTKGPFMTISALGDIA